jgi:hypothetical protein
VNPLGSRRVVTFSRNPNEAHLHQVWALFLLALVHGFST